MDLGPSRRKMKSMQIRETESEMKAEQRKRDRGGIHQVNSMILSLELWKV